MKKILLSLLKFALAAGIIGWLLYSSAEKPEFRQVMRGTKDWPLLGLAFVLFFTSVSATFVRWQLLVWALDFPFTLRLAFRYGFLGYLFNFVAPGGVGGDLFKAVAIAHEYHGRRAQAVATVVIDRIVGLYALFIVAATAVLLDGLWRSPSPSIRSVAFGTLAGTAAGAVGIVMLLIPGFTSGRLSQFLGNLPRTGRIFRQLLDAVRMYRMRLRAVFASLAVSIVVHLLTVVGFYVIGLALPGAKPTLAEHFVIVPLAMVISAIPITPGGLGTMELAVAELFSTMSQQQVDAAQGLAVSLVFRLMTIVIAMTGVVVYAVSRREISEVVHEAEEVETAESA